MREIVTNYRRLVDDIENIPEAPDIPPQKGVPVCMATVPEDYQSDWYNKLTDLDTSLVSLAEMKVEIKKSKDWRIYKADVPKYVKGDRFTIAIIAMGAPRHGSSLAAEEFKNYNLLSRNSKFLLRYGSENKIPRQKYAQVPSWLHYDFLLLHGGD
ncbi:hypothetical protein QYM36_015142 [Artemia franciscana]|uniref:Uncharacterized protein n=1 Tax=Artemia franciscana TaxID=6661 RepID=A0AA88KYZ5_ARTSF|nr:hypothetical protein QYM36_015142 [Artemia franciscana]